VFHAVERVGNRETHPSIDVFEGTSRGLLKATKYHPAGYEEAYHHPISEDRVATPPDSGLEFCLEEPLFLILLLAF
jgi:hypothetical protein